MNIQLFEANELNLPGTTQLLGHARTLIYDSDGFIDVIFTCPFELIDRSPNFMHYSGLMQEEDLDELGFKHEVSIDEAKFEELRKNKKERKGYIGGLSAKGWTDEELGAKSESE